MKKNAKIFDLLLIISALVLSFGAFAGISEDCGVSYKSVAITTDGTAEAELFFSIPKGWKLPKTPNLLNPTTGKAELPSYSYNEGNVDGYAKLIKDDIPQGLEFLPQEPILA